nr:hypothetical protein [Tanacetum cinerariifolium]
MNPAKSAMQRAWYEYDTEVKLPAITPGAGFTVLADTCFKPTGFVSIEERLLRNQSTISDTTITFYRAAW